MTASRIDRDVATTILAALDRAKIAVAVTLRRGEELEWIDANEYQAQRLGYTREELMALHPLAIVAHVERPRTDEIIRRIGGGGEQPPVFMELSLLHRDGHEVPSDVSTREVPTDDGGFIAVHLVRDLGHGRAPSWLESDRLSVVGALAAGIAHEINNPLTYVLLHLRSLRRALDEGGLSRDIDVARLIDEAYAGADRIRAIVRAVNSLAASPGQPMDVDLGAIVQSALRLVRPELESRARVVCQFFPVALVHGEEPRLGQVVLSMMLFATAGFQGDDPTLNRVVLAVEMRDEEATFEVSDNGRDLTPGELERVDSVIRRVGDLPGCSLAVARSIAMTAGGRLAIARRPGGGLRTTLSLPTVAHGRG